MTKRIRLAIILLIVSLFIGFSAPLFEMMDFALVLTGSAPINTMLIGRFVALGAMIIEAVAYFIGLSSGNPRFKTATYLIIVNICLCLCDIALTTNLFGDLFVSLPIESGNLIRFIRLADSLLDLYFMFTVINALSFYTLDPSLIKKGRKISLFVLLSCICGLMSSFLNVFWAATGSTFISILSSIFSIADSALTLTYMILYIIFLFVAKKRLEY